MRQARDNDVTFIQETKLQRSQAAIVRSKWRSNNIFMSCADTSRRGVLTLVHPRVDPVHLQEISDPNGQFHILVSRMYGETYLLVNIYGNPDEDRHAEATLVDILRHMDQASITFVIQHIVMAGDFNFVLLPSDSFSTTRKPRAEAVCTTIINLHNLYDVAALQSPNPVHTYFRHRREATSARYDRFYCSPSLLSNATFRPLPRVGDHAPIQFNTSLTKSPSSWTFSDNLLNDPLFLQGLHNCLHETLSEFTPDNSPPLIQLQNNIDFDHNCSSSIFSKVVRKVRSYCVDETRIRGRLRKEKEDGLIQNLVLARNAVNASATPSAELVDNLEAAQQKLVIAQSCRAQAAANNNHINYAAFGERMSRYHFQRSGRGKSSREIPKLVVHTDNGARSLDSLEVPVFMFEKYAGIAQEDPVVGTMSIEEFLGPALTTSLRVCPVEDHLRLTSPICAAEISSIVKAFKPVSAPGPLGLSNNLLKEIVPYLSAVLVDLGNRLFFADEMPHIDPFFSHRLVVFILKPGKDSLDADSYRGLSLLENSFKVFSKILAQRIQRPMTYVQDPQQFGFTRRKGCLEASRTVIDTIRHAKVNGLPLIVISTDFKKAFDSIALNHIEACLHLYQFPQEFVIAFMRLVRSGTMQFQINSSTSEEHELLAGTGQGDPKSSFAFNLAAAPLNHYLAKSPDVPRYEVEGVGTTPIFYADDALTLLKGDMIDQIIVMLHKIREFRNVSGLFLNLLKCEILAINCNPDDVARLIAATNMKSVTTLKHLGLLINSDGLVTHEDNIVPIQNAMDKIADSLSTVSATPLGRSIYAKFLLSSRYLHKIQNFDFTPQQLDDLRTTVLRLTWTRHRIGTDTSSSRVHIANARVAQPVGFGGLSVPDPNIQTKALRFTWARKFLSIDPQLTWVRLLELLLHDQHRPGIKRHLSLGVQEWSRTGNSLVVSSPFWSNVFLTISNLISLSHEYDRCWTLIPITGYERSDFNIIDISSLAYSNPVVRRMVDAGLVNIGQLFQTNVLGHVDATRCKDFAVLEIEFAILISNPVRNSLTGLVNQVRRRYMGASSYAQSPSTTLLSLLTRHPSGCHDATRLLLRHQRQDWEWGENIRSFFTYSNDNLISISSSEFSKAFYTTRSSTLSPSVQWTSFQVLLRTLWTNIKEQRTTRNILSLNPVSPMCSNCHALPEHTAHLLFHCQLAQDVWTAVADAFNACASLLDNLHVPLVISLDHVLFNHSPPTNRRDIVDLLMLVKHVLYRLKFRTDLASTPSIRRVLVIAVIDLEKAIVVRNSLNKNTTLFTNVTESLRSRVGF